MGSLMPGWDTLQQPNKVMKRSKTSLTKDEIEAFWRLKQQEMEAHTKENHALNANNLPATPYVTGCLSFASCQHGTLDSLRELSISETKLLVTTTVTPDGNKAQEVVITWPQPTASSRDWWTRSNWAYLNAPPEIADYPGQPRHRPYVPQHDIATRFNRSVSFPV